MFSCCRCKISGSVNILAHTTVTHTHTHSTTTTYIPNKETKQHSPFPLKSNSTEKKIYKTAVTHAGNTYLLNGVLDGLLNGLTHAHDALDVVLFVLTVDGNAQQQLQQPTHLNWVTVFTCTTPSLISNMYLKFSCQFKTNFISDLCVNFLTQKEC